MNELSRGLKETLEKLKKDKKALITVVVGVVGMLLILLSELPVFSGERDKKSESNENIYINNSLEEQTEKLISQIKGAGKVSVMLTYESSEESIWATDYDRKSKADGESDENEKHIIIDGEDGETGLAVKVIYPKVRGVAVVCSGGDDPTVRSEIKALLSALFDIGSNRISIARRAVKE